MYHLDGFPCFNSCLSPRFWSWIDRFVPVTGIRNNELEISDELVKSEDSERLVQETDRRCFSGTYSDVHISSLNSN